MFIRILYGFYLIGFFTLLGLHFITPSKIPAYSPRQDGLPRVVSINGCTDQYALLLGAPGQVISVTQYATDPTMNAYSHLAEGIYQNVGAEDIYLMQPDVVFASRWSDPNLRQALINSGIEVVVFESVTDINHVTERLLQAAEHMDRMDYAQQIVDTFNQQYEEITNRISDDPNPLGALYAANGYTGGQNSVAGQILESAGYNNLATELGYNRGGRIQLEVLIYHMPDLILRSGLYGGDSNAEDVLDHTALDAMAGEFSDLRSNGVWFCGTPDVLDDMNKLVEARRIITERE